MIKVTTLCILLLYFMVNIKENLICFFVIKVQFCCFQKQKFYIGISQKITKRCRKFLKKLLIHKYTISRNILITEICKDILNVKLMIHSYVIKVIFI